ncbi:hypothetical protein GW835_02215 [archaeon]|nr:hypothetical protein [archaeon]NCP79361.1 hypothetical protein [archaeon]NCQ07128.1 hypothetical protein [archaeon]
MSGTSTQIQDTIDFFKSKNYIVKDLRGTEIDLLFHAEIFKEYNKEFISFKEFLKSKKIKDEDKSKLLFEIYYLLSGYNRNNDLLVGSFKKNKVTTYINPDSADVWILEEPSKRSAGQTNRVIEQNRSSFDFLETNYPTHDSYSAVLLHQAYRIDEFYRIRKILRDHNKIIVRSRSEESACYQIYDEKYNQSGVSLKDYISLPGHKIAFKYPPTDLFIVCGPEKWEIEEYTKFREKRSEGRILDDYELNTRYQLLVNERYASKWIEELYKVACSENRSEYLPNISRINIYDSKINVRNKMFCLLEKIIKR